MSFLDDYNKLKKKRKEEEWNAAFTEDGDIAPVKDIIANRPFTATSALARFSKTSDNKAVLNAPVFERNTQDVEQTPQKFTVKVGSVGSGLSVVAPVGSLNEENKESLAASRAEKAAKEAALNTWYETEDGIRYRVDENGRKISERGYLLDELDHETNVRFDAIPDNSTGQLGAYQHTGNDIMAGKSYRETHDTDSWFKNPLWEDGYDFGDATKTILGSTLDVGANMGEGIVKTLEGVADFGMYIGAYGQQWQGNDEIAAALRSAAKYDIVGNLYDDDAESVTDQYSVFGDKSDSISNALGQVLLMAATGGTASAAGAGQLGTTAITTGTTFASSAGNSTSEAYASGADDSTAMKYGLLAGGVEAGSELVFGGLGKGINALGYGKGLTSIDDTFAKKLSSKISNQFLANAAEYGVKASAEGLEEVLAGLGTAAAKKLSGLSEEDYWQLVKDEKLLDQFVAGLITSSIAQGGDFTSSVKNKTDFVTGLTQNEQKVIDQVYENTIAEQEKNGEKLTEREKKEIYDQIVEGVDKGYISIEDIENALGDKSDYDSILKESEEYDNLYNTESGKLSEKQKDRLAELKEKNSTTPYADALEKSKSAYSENVYNMLRGERNGMGSKLLESYNERARRGMAYEADLSQYDAKQQAVIQKAIDSGILNNTNRTHEFVDLIAKISADKGVLFDFTNNEKLKGSSFAIEGKTVNGYVTEDGVTLNINSAKALNAVVGHEITHVLEGTEFYTELQNAITEYAKTKGEYQSRYDTLAKLYSGVKDANIEAELTADLVGDYLFTDSNFVRHLSTQNRNVFQKIWDEIKYLYSVATAGSKEARELAKVKKVFEEAYRAGGKNADGDVQYSLVEDQKTIDFLENQEHITTYKAMALIDGKLYPPMASQTRVKEEYTDKKGNKKTKNVRKLKNPSVLGQWQQADERIDIAKEKYNPKLGYSSFDLLKSNGKTVPAAYNPYEHTSNIVLNDQFEEAYNRPELVTVEYRIPVSELTSGYKAEYAKDAVGQHNWKSGPVAKDLAEPRQVYLTRWSKPVRIVPDSEVAAKYKEILDGTGISVPFNVVTPSLLSELEKAGVPIDYEGSPMYKGIQKKAAEKNVKYSLSDSDGRKLTNEQQAYFKDSKMRDDQGNLKVMYHGSQDAGFHVFDSSMSDDGTSFFFVDRNDVAASYSGTSETYEARSIRTPNDMNNFLAEIGYDHYKAVEKNGKFELLENNEHIATKDTMQEIYEEFCWYEGIGEGDANYKVYLNLTNPLEVDAGGRNWNNISREFSQDVYDRYQSLTAEEKAALTDLAEWGEYGIFKDEILSMAKAKADGQYHDATLASAYEKLGGANANLHDAFTIAEDNFSEDTLRQFAAKQMNTRDYAKKAKAEGYDGVIFKNIVDIGGYGGDYTPSTVAIAFDSNQIKSVANEKPTGNADIRYSLSGDGHPVTKDTKSEVSFSLSNDTAYMDKAISMNDSMLRVNSDVMSAAKMVRERIASRMNEIKDRGLVGLPEDIEGNTYIANSSYDGTEENTTICPRSLASEAFTDAVSEYLGRPLSVEEQIYISQDLQGRSLTPECTYCYVATDRKAYRAFLGEYINQRDAVLQKVQSNPNAGVSRNGDMYKEFLDGRKDTEPMYKRFKMWVDAYKNGTPMVDASHLANINKLMGDINSEFGEALRLQIVDAMKYAQSASWAKKRVNYVAYNGHILKWKQDRINKLNSHYGLRMYSFSDFHPAFVLENMQMITDASVRGLKMLGYTKDTDFVEIFAPSGMNINVSTFGFETGGNVYENNIIGAEWEKAKALREQYPNVGVTFVATNDTLVNWALDQDWIDVVIPYHLVRTGTEVAKAFGYTNYTSESSDTKTKEWAKGDKKNIAPTEHNNDLETYRNALEKNHLNPRFERFIDHPNYMKLVNECRQSASQSKPVQPVFNEEAAMKALAKLEANGYYQPVGGSVERMYEIAAEVAENMNRELAPTMSLSENGEQSRKFGSYNVYGNDIALEGLAPTVSEMESVAPVDVPKMETTTENIFPDAPFADPASVELDRLNRQKAELESRMMGAIGAEDFDAYQQINAEYDTLMKRMAEVEQEVATADADRINSLADADVPPEMEAPYRGESYDADPFAERDIVDVGKRSVKAYMYENPEVKPFFQAEARAMLGDLQSSIKGERLYNDELYYQSGGEKGWMGTKRRTTAHIAELLDQWNYTYAEIEKGLNAIIEDHGAENNAISKRIEFMLDDRLRNGYDDMWGEPIPADQAYIDMLNEKQVNEYSKEAFDAFMANADKYDPAPMEDDIAPVVKTPANVPDAPIFENASGQQTMWEEPAKKVTTRKELHQNLIDDVKARFSEKGMDFDKVLKEAKNLSTFRTVDNTPQRVMEKALGYKAGSALADLTVNKVAQNETEGIKWLNSYTDRKNGVLAQISKQYSIKPGSKESAAAQMYAEGFYVGENNEIIAYGDAELAKDFPNANVQRNIKGLASDPRIRQIYDDTLAMINESRARNLYPEIPRLDNYFLHFRAMEDTFSRLGLPFNPNDIKAKDLPTDLNGVTADLKPGQPYFASAMHRTGKRTSFDLLGGLEKYLSSAKNQIYHIDDIQTMRALRNYIADTYGQANGLNDLDSLSEEEAQERIKEVYNSHLSTFAKFLNEEANILAGKTALIDRGLEGIIGRRGITFLDTVNRQVGSNMVGFNVSSSLTNFISVAQTFAKTNKADFVKAFGQTVGNKVGSMFGRSDSFTENSPVVIRRKGADRFYRTPFQKAGDIGYSMMQAVDNISTELIARTKYNELTRKGMDSQQAHFETDKWVSKLMGDRSLGQMPQLYNSKMLGLFTKFQLEVRNQLDSQFYDTIQETKASNEDIQNGLARNAKTAAKVTSTFVQLAVAQHLFGKAFESIAGYNPAFDIISVVMKAFGWDDEEDSEDTALDNLEQAFMELLGDLPYTSTFTGGRIPVSSALPIEQFIMGEDQYGNEKSRWETLAEIAPYYVLPGGYGQLKKTWQGMSMFSDDHPIAGSYTDSGNLRFPVDDTFGNKLQAGIFGQWANSNAQDYIDNERKPLSEKQIQEFIDVGISIQDYWEYREGLSGLKTLAEKADYINGLDLTDEQKNVLINNIADRKEDIDMSDYGNYGSWEEFDYAQKNPEKYSWFNENGISYSDYDNADENAKNAYNWAYENPEKYQVSKAISDDLLTYYQYKGELYDIKADKDENGKTINGSRKEKVIDYINDLDADYGAKIILFKMEYPSDDSYNNDIIDYLNDRDDISYGEMETILKELGFTVHSDGRVTWD